MSGTATVLYDTTVTAVGPMVDDFRRQGVVILFDERAPEELRDFAVIHDPSVVDSGPAVGDVVVLGDVELPVLAVGAVAGTNLLALGHLDLKADGRSEAALPGDVCVPEGELPQPVPGMRFALLRRAGADGVDAASGGVP
jgi:PTS system glucitol/sorbitol-specific IIA component